MVEIHRGAYRTKEPVGRTIYTSSRGKEEGHLPVLLGAAGLSPALHMLPRDQGLYPSSLQSRVEGHLPRVLGAAGFSPALNNKSPWPTGCALGYLGP